MKTRIGIFGGGQLGAYLCQAAATLRMETYVVCFSPSSMAAEYADHTFVAAPDSPAAAAWLVANSDVVTFDTESVPAAALTAFAEADHLRVAPGADTLRLLQDKYTQKRWLLEHNFPTAEFLECDETITMVELRQQFGDRFIQKTRQGGYDGKGVQLLDRDSSDQKLWRGNAFAERFVERERELAVLVARGASGGTAVYPVIDMRFEEAGHILREASSPAALDGRIAAQAQDLGQKIVTEMGGVGLFAIELFLEPDGSLLVNEISPRVHNTGHLTIEAHATSQYEQHLRAITGMPLGSTGQLSPVALMLNVLQCDTASEEHGRRPGTWPGGSATTVHWYGKPGGPSFRKMGHITSLADSRGTALHHASQALINLSEPEQVA